jgi:hypothetical protein
VVIQLGGAKLAQIGALVEIGIDNIELVQNLSRIPAFFYLNIVLTGLLFRIFGQGSILWISRRNRTIR